MHCEKLPTLDALKIGPQDLVVTANQRLAIRLRESYDQRQQMAGKLTWQTPTILPFTSWIKSLWQDNCAKGRLCLSQDQALLLWQQIIQDHDDSPPLLQPTATSSLALNARQLLSDWCLPLSVLKVENHRESMVFYAWANAFDAYCQQHQLAATPHLLPELLLIDPKTLIPTLNPITLLGFDALTPAAEQWVALCQTQVEIRYVTIEKPAQSQQTIACHDQHHELETMVQWAVKMLQEYPKMHIGCVIPNLQQQRRKIHDTFTQALTPTAWLPGSKNQLKQFNISAGQPLYTLSIIHTAIGLLHWLTGNIDMAPFAMLSQSPYLIHSPSDLDYAALLDLHLKKCQTRQIAFSELFTATHSDVKESADTTHLLYRLQQFYRFQQKLPSKASPQQWVQYWITALELLGWPGTRTLNSEEYQALSRFQELLNAFAEYSIITPQITQHTALVLLTQLAKKTPFQTEGSHARLQILGALEASGNDFDALWVMGLTDDVWPPAPNPNPFIPYDIQRTHQMPHATAERERIYTEQLMHRLTHSAAQLIFSYAQQSGDTQLSPSTLLQQIPSIEITELHLSQPNSIEEIIYNSSQLEHLADDKAPAILSTEKIVGGSWVLKYQSLCPFKAFATARLLSEEPDEFLLGLSPADRGIITHDVLDRLWAQLKNQKTLISLSTTALHTLISHTVDQAIEAAQQTCHTTFEKSLLDVERTRLIALIQQWCKLEAQRPPFEVIYQEQRFTIQIGKMKTSIRVDRIDRLPSGEHLVIDYKTNTNHITHWFGERLEDPQLPLYACATLTPPINNIAGISFAEVNPKRPSFKGIVSENFSQALNGIISIEKIKPDYSWQQQRIKWQQQLEALSTEYLNGHAAVLPKDPITTCQYCDLHSLCRITQPCANEL